MQKFINVASGKQPADLVIKNGRYLSVFTGEFLEGDIAIHDGIIAGIGEFYQGKSEIDAKGEYIVPGFIDSHVHIESSQISPSQFQNVVLPRGTTTVIWDPHEIANVKGTAGLNWALKATENLLLDVFIMLSSCVPAIAPEMQLETSSHQLNVDDLLPLIDHPRVLGLAEMMNYPGVLQCQPDVLAKLEKFRNSKKDGHSPLLSGKNLNAYIGTGINTEHEATTLPEAQEKVRKGMSILIREGSSAKNLEALLPLLKEVMLTRIAFCTDDCNVHDLIHKGHIDAIINKALKHGYSPEDLFRVASYSAATIYGLEDRGAIAPGYIADFCRIKPIENNWKKGFKINAVYKKGLKEWPEKTAIHSDEEKNVYIKFPADKFKLRQTDIHIISKAKNTQKVRVIGIKPGQIITDNLIAKLPVNNGLIEPDIKQDILKIAVFERHKKTGNYSIGFVKGFGLQQGAIAQTIAHDSHNLIVIGANDTAIVTAVNHIVSIDGGIVVVDAACNCISLPLPIGGLMSNADANKVAAIIDQQKKLAQSLGSNLADPFLQLAFLALPVIPSLKITDLGLVDADNFTKVESLL